MNSRLVTTKRTDSNAGDVLFFLIFLLLCYLLGSLKSKEKRPWQNNNSRKGFSSKLSSGCRGRSVDGVNLLRNQTPPYLAKYADCSYALAVGRVLNWRGGWPLSWPLPRLVRAVRSFVYPWQATPRQIVRSQKIWHLPCQNVSYGLVTGLWRSNIQSLCVKY